MNKSAILSNNKKYRYSLGRCWDESKPILMFIMLNPSTADDKEDDPTIRRCIGFAKSWGYGAIIVCNLIPYRATNPKELLSIDDNEFLGTIDNKGIVGYYNSAYISKLSQKVDKVVCAWGNSNVIKKLRINISKIKEIVDKPLYYIEISKDGTPKHPLYLKSDNELKLWT